MRCEIFLVKSVKIREKRWETFGEFKITWWWIFRSSFPVAKLFNILSFFSLSLHVPKLTTNRCFSNSICTFVSMHRKWITDKTGSFVSHSTTEKLGMVFLHFFTPTSWKVLHSLFSSVIFSLSDFCHNTVCFWSISRTKKCAFITCDVSVAVDNSRKRDFAT